jgi:hypothetical protein
MVKIEDQIAIEKSKRKLRLGMGCTLILKCFDDDNNCLKQDITKIKQ